MSANDMATEAMATATAATVLLQAAERVWERNSCPHEDMAAYLDCPWNRHAAELVQHVLDERGESA